MQLQQLMADVEQVSAAYAKRYNFQRDSHWLLHKLAEEHGELVQSFLKLTGQARSEDDVAVKRQAFEDELADVLCHVLLLAKHHDVDLETALQRKWLQWLP